MRNKLFILAAIVFFTSVMSCKTETINESECLYKARVNDRYGYIDRDGNIVVEPEYYYAEEFTEGLATVSIGSIDGKCGYIDKTGKMVIEPKFDDAYPFSEGLASVEIDKKWGFIDKTGNIVVDFKYY